MQLYSSARNMTTGVVAILLVVASLAGCATRPTFSDAATALDEEAIPMHLGRVQTQTQDGVTVQLVIPTDEQVAGHFGVPLAQFGIQPIWIRIDNASSASYWILPISIDPNYFTADEAALLATDDMDAEDDARVTEIFRQSALPFFLQAGSVHEGYVYASLERGGRFVDLRATAQGHGLVRMRFAVMLPTEGFDYESSTLRRLYELVDNFPDLTLEQARVRIRELPCCTARADGSGEGDPINLALVGSGEDVISALTAGGWTFTEAITVDSVRRMIGAAIADEEFRNAPVSALYLFGRKQDLALQRGRSKIAQRNHMRLWLAPFRCEGQPVWVGQVSRDIGVKATSKSPTLTTHIIDPNVDESREYVLHSLFHHEAVRWFAFVRGVGAAPRDQPRHNLTDDPYFTDGNRLAVGVSRVPVPPPDAVNLGWNESYDPILEGKGEDARVKQDH
jgi:LssY C-terminus